MAFVLKERLGWEDGYAKPDMSFKDPSTPTLESRVHERADSAKAATESCTMTGLMELTPRSLIW